MESKAHATIAGAFVILMVALVIGIVLWFSQDKTVRIPYDIITADSAGGVVPRASVELQGIKIGYVESISFMPENPGHVRIRLQVDERAPITNATYATLSFRGVTGAVFVDLGEDPSVPVASRQRLSVARGNAAPNIPLRAGTLENLAGSVQGILIRADHTLSRLEGWLSEENEKTLFGTIDRIGRTAEQMEHLSATFNAKGGRVLDQVSGVMSGAEKAVANLTSPEGALTRISEGTQALAQAAEHLNFVTLPYIDNAAGSVDQTVRALKRFLQTLEAQPQSLLFGPAQRQPGPGEPGYVSPYQGQGGQ